jgi:hypothetical protein
VASELFSKIEKINAITTIREYSKTIGDYEEEKEILKYICSINDNIEIYHDLIERLQKGGTLTDAEITTLLSIEILYYTEGPLGVILNMLIRALQIKEHHDVWDDRSNKFIKDVFELNNISLSNKLEFLKEHGINLDDICPRDLRNAIAHQSYYIEPDGTLITLKRYKKSTPITKAEMLKKYTNLAIFIEKTFEIMIRTSS